MERLYVSVPCTVDFTKLQKRPAERNQDEGIILLLAWIGGQRLVASATAWFFCIPWKGRCTRLQEVLCHNPATPGDVLDSGHATCRGFWRRPVWKDIASRLPLLLLDVSRDRGMLSRRLEKSCDEGVTLVGYQGGILPIHHSPALVTVFSYDNLHAMAWKYIWACSNRSTGRLH